MYSVSFRKGNYAIWKVIDYNSGDTRFRSSYVVDGYYTNHKTYDNIDEAAAAYVNSNI